jgi:hypothetical protein
MTSRIAVDNWIILNIRVTVEDLGIVRPPRLLRAVAGQALLPGIPPHLRHAAHRRSIQAACRARPASPQPAARLVFGSLPGMGTLRLRSGQAPARSRRVTVAGSMRKHTAPWVEELALDARASAIARDRAIAPNKLQNVLSTVSDSSHFIKECHQQLHFSSEVLMYQGRVEHT